MLKWLFRIAVILVLLLGISKYTSIFDNTKIKPYLDNVDTIISNQVDTIQNRFTGSWTGDQETVTGDSNIINTTTTWSSSFEKADELVDEQEINSSWSNLTNVVEDVIDRWSNTWVGNSGTDRIATLRIKNCVTPWWKFIPKNGYAVAYESRSSSECKREKRYCNNGTLEWSYQYDTCLYTSTITKQQSSALLSAQQFEAIKLDYNLFAISYIAPKNWSGLVHDLDTLSGKSAGPGVIVESYISPDDTQWASSFLEFTGSNAYPQNPSQIIYTSPNDPNKHYLGRQSRGIEILSNGQTELNNNVLKTYSLKKQLAWQNRIVFTTDDKTLYTTSDYSRKICTTPRWTLVSNGQFVTAFKTPNEINWICEAETRFCIDGTLQGSFVYPSCEGVQPAMIHYAPSIVTDTINTKITNDVISVWYSETRNVLKNDLIPLDPMPIPDPTVTLSPDVEDSDYNLNPEYIFLGG